jgi:hypothetical protein
VITNLVSVKIRWQDVYLTGNPQITFFKVVYRRHTNFSIENIEQPLNNADFGKKAFVVITRNGDLVTKMYLRVRLPAISYAGQDRDCTRFAWVRKLGHVLIDYVECEIGGSRIDKHWGDWLTIWQEIARDISHDRGYNKMIGDVPELTRLDPVRDASTGTIKDEYTLYIPLQFWFNRNNGLALPLIALQYHEVRLNFFFRSFDQCCIFTNNVKSASLFNRGTTGVSISMDATLLVDYIYLDSEERRRFAQVGHEYLIEQLQFTGEVSVNTTNIITQLYFNHPVKFLVWGLKLGYYQGGRFLAYSHTTDWTGALEEAARNIALGKVWQRADCNVPICLECTVGEVTTDVTLFNDPTMDTTRFEWPSGTNATIIISDGSTSPLVVGPCSFNLGGGVAVGCSLPQGGIAVTIPHIKAGVPLLQCDTQEDYGNLVEVCGYNLVPARNPDGSVKKFTDTPLIGAACGTGTAILPTSVTSYRVIPVLGDINLTIKHLSLPLDNFSIDNRSWTGHDVIVWQRHNYGLLIDESVNPTVRGNLKLNGQDRFQERSGNYFNYVQPWQHFEVTPADGINTYSFGLRPIEHQPSGACNMSRIDTAQLNLFFNSQSANRQVVPVFKRTDFIGSNNVCTRSNVHNLFIYAFNYNVLRIMSGIDVITSQILLFPTVSCSVGWSMNLLEKNSVILTFNITG